MTNNTGTSSHNASEVIIGTHYGKKFDVYSFATTLWEICEKEKPFKGLKDVMTILWKVVQEKTRPSLKIIFRKIPIWYDRFNY